jgi:hypothetical protein
MEILFLLLAILAVFFLTKSEYMSNPEESDYVETIATETPDRNQQMIFLTQDYLKKYHKLCGYCIETRSIQKFTNKKDNSVKYRCAYMFMILGGYPYGLSVTVELVLEPEPKVLLLSLQPLTTKSDLQIVPFTDEVAKPFLSYDEVLASVKPKKLPIVN